MLPMYTQVNAMGLRNSYAGVMLPFLVNMSSVFFFRQFLSGIPYEMIEAARVDGATRMQIIRHIIIPSILPTYFVIVMLNIASFLNNGMEQYYVFQNDFNRKYIEVLDLYVYNYARSSIKNYPLSTAISMLKSIVSVALLAVTNTVSKLIRGDGFI